MYPEMCENSVVDENNKYKRRRCKITGYLCKPTVFRDHGKSECVFEPQYLDRTTVKQMIEIIKSLKPGMRVYWTYKTASHTWLKTQDDVATGTIKEIQDDGKIIIATDQFIIDWTAYIHDVTRNIKLDKKELEPILKQLEEELELEERIRKESGEDRAGKEE